MALIEHHVLDEIRSKIRLSDLIAKDVKLSKHGAEFKGLSPFQDEKTPSFTVNDAKQFWHCFSSKRHGDHFQWLQDYKGMAFRDAVKTLAQEAKVPLPEARSGSTAKPTDRAGAMAACAAAATYWQVQLRSQGEGRAARAYLERRGVPLDLATALGLGWAPRSSHGLFQALREQGVGREAMTDAGLLSLAENGKGFFRERLMFPIKDMHSAIIGFGGRRIRTVEEDGPKYLNSRDTILFKKREAFYGLDVAMPVAARRGRLVIVEGYMDAIAMWRAGINETVAAQGSTIDFTAVRRLMPKLVERVILFDGDRAGQSAYDRMLDSALLDAAPGCVTKFAELTGGEDPDGYLRSHTVSELTAVLDRAAGLEDSLWRRTLARSGGDLGPEGRSAVVRELIRCTETIVHSETKAWFHTMLAARVVREFGLRRRLEEEL